MKRTCIFASYDKDGIIKSYVISYLKYLKEVSDDIIFVSDCNYTDFELSKISGLISYHSCEHHGEYDFGSYKRGILYLLEKGQGRITSDEIILCNDSCFCIDSLTHIFQTMSQKECDFWGLTSSSCLKRHLQSFFLVIKNNVSNSVEFLNYFKNVESKKSILDVISCYELPFLTEMEKAGYIGESFTPLLNDNPTFFPISLIQQGVPLVKKKCFSDPMHCCQSILCLGRIIKKKNNNVYREILEYYGKKGIFSIYIDILRIIIFNKLKNFKIIKIDYFRSGTIRYRFLGIPVYFKKKNKSD